MKITHRGRPVGEVRGDTFYKTLKRDHFLRVPVRSIAFTPHTLWEAQQAGAVYVEVTEKETGIKYQAVVQTIREKGVSIERGGFEQQFYWPLDKWEVTDPKQTKLL